MGEGAWQLAGHGVVMKFEVGTGTDQEDLSPFGHKYRTGNFSFIQTLAKAVRLCTNHTKGIIRSVLAIVASMRSSSSQEREGSPGAILAFSEGEILHSERR
jgi:hypothetical protein